MWGIPPENLLATPKGNHKIHNCCYQQDLRRQLTLSAAGAKSQGLVKSAKHVTHRQPHIMLLLA